MGLEACREWEGFCSFRPLHWNAFEASNCHIMWGDAVLLHQSIFLVVGREVGLIANGTAVNQAAVIYLFVR